MQTGYFNWKDYNYDVISGIGGGTATRLLTEEQKQSKRKRTLARYYRLKNTQNEQQKIL